MGIERTATPNHAAAATVEALLAENVRLATQMAMLATPTPTPVPNLGRLAYVQGGDIWTKALPDSTPGAKRVTTDGLNREPRWSPSGQWLAFRKERSVVVQQEVPCDVPQPRSPVCTDRVTVLLKQVWLMEADGSGAHPLSQGTSVETFAWSPKGDRLAYVTANSGLQTIKADGTDLTTLVTTAFPERDTQSVGRVGRIAWNPEGTWIAYEWRIQLPDQSPSYQGLWKVSADGKERTELYASGAPKKGEAILSGWSPQGKTVLFWQADVRGASADGVPFYGVFAEKGSARNDPRLIETDGVLVYQDFVAPAPPGTLWGTRDGVAVVTGSGRSTWTGKLIKVAAKALRPKSAAAISPAWSPDGTHLAYAAMTEGGEPSTQELVQQGLLQRRIWVTNTGNEPQLRLLTDTPGYRDERPLWSADGSHILFVRIDIKGRASLWIVSLNGGAPRQIVDELTPSLDPVGFYGHVEWDSLFDWWRGP